MNDNVPPSSPHHVECLRILNDLHDLLDWAERNGIKVAHEDERVTYAMDFGFWKSEIAAVLHVSPVAGKNIPAGKL